MQWIKARLISCCQACLNSSAAHCTIRPAGVSRRDQEGVKGMRENTMMSPEFLNWVEGAALASPW